MIGLAITRRPSFFGVSGAGPSCPVAEHHGIRLAVVGRRRFVLLGCRDPVDVLCVNQDYNSADWVPYTGPVADSDEYRAAQARYAGCLRPTETQKEL